MAPPIPPAASKEIEAVKSLVAKHFPVYDVRVTYDVVEFFVRVDMTTLDETFERMREEMGHQGYIPMISYDKGEHIVIVAKKPTTKYRSTYVNLALLIVTFLTMLLAGANDWAGYAGLDGSSLFSPDVLLMGMLTFTLPLMAILAVHELAHFFAARRRGIAASLPFFIPSFPPLGTFGAFISLRDPMPNKKTLLEVGIAGPLAGLAVAIPLAILGLYMTNLEAKPVPINIGSEGVMGVSFPMIYTWLEQILPIEGDYLLHPTAFAAWVGFLVTALNLLPAGQLDGGHVARALLGARAKYLSWVTAAALVGIGLIYFGWLLFAFLILALGARHPPPLNDLTPLDTKRKAVGIFAFVILVIAFVPVPISPINADFSFELEAEGDTNLTIQQGGYATMSVTVSNTGNAYNGINLYADAYPAGWNISFKPAGSEPSAYDDSLSILLNASETFTYDVRIVASPAAELSQNYNVSLAGVSLNNTGKMHLYLNLTVTGSVFTYSVLTPFADTSTDSWAQSTVLVENAGPADATIAIVPNALQPQFMDVVIVVGEVNSTEPVDLLVPAGGSATFTVEVFVSQYASTGEYVISVEIYLDGVFQKSMNLALNVV